MDVQQELTRRFVRHANWYVLFVETSKEQDVKRRLSAALPDNIFVIFVPTKTYSKTKAGKRAYETKKMFGGYVFVATEEREDLTFASIRPLVRRDERAYRFLSSTDSVVSADEENRGKRYWQIKLPERDKALLDALLDDAYNIPAFDAIQIGGRVEFAPGHILEGMANNIVLKSVNKHRGTGVIEYKLFGETRHEEVALNMIEAG
jgi:transcription antitermination factor NusG